MKTVLDNAAGWWLENITCDTENNTVSFILYEKILVGKQLCHTTDSRRALVRFSGVVAYLMADEANLPGSTYDERDDGCLHVYTASEFLDFMSGSRGQSFFNSFPKPSRHYSLATSDHIVHVLATEAPHVEVVRSQANQLNGARRIPG